MYAQLRGNNQGVVKLIGKVKSTAGLAGVPEILVPGERGVALLKQAEKSGEIEIEETLLEELKKAAA
jgi:LDH2 family malate/lactate/ureidoglycolate dehydrogenase